MGTKYLNYILALAAVLALLCGGGALAENAVRDMEIGEQPEYEYKEIKAVYHNGANNVFYDTGFLYSDAMLLEDAGKLSTDLAKASAALAMAAYDSDEVCDVLEAMDFLVIDGAFSYYIADSADIYDCDHVGYTIAQRVIGDYMVYCVPVRGTARNAEWFSDFDLGKTGDHKGFYAAAAEVKAELYSHMTYDGYSADKTIVWMMGHSRGAAVSNIIAGELTRSGEYAAAEHIFSYNFACPAVTKNGVAAYDNIYNFNGSGDLVPALPLSNWGYERYGHTITMNQTQDTNFLRCFEEMTGSAFSSASTTAGYLSLFNTLIQTEEDFHEPTNRLIILIAAYGLGGKHKATLLDVWDFSGYQAKDWLWDIISGKNNLVELIEGIQNSTESIFGLMSIYESYLEEVVGMTDEEFEVFRQQNAALFNEMSMCVGHEIKTREDFVGAKSFLEYVVGEHESFGEVLGDVFSIFFSADGNVLESVAEAHTQAAYVLAINSRYFGYEGWRGSDISSLSLPADCTTVGAYCFYDCANIADLTLNDNLEAIGSGAFYGCSGFDVLEIPNSVKHIGKTAFGDCSGLRDVTMPVEMAVASIFNSKCCVERIHYTTASTGVMPDRVSEYSYNAENYYQYCLEYYSARSLKRAVFDDGIVHIASYAFYHGRENGALEEVVLPPTLQSIGDCAFKGLPQLKMDILLPDGLVSLGVECFSGAGITGVYLPQTLVEIPEKCFYECANMSVLEIHPGVQAIGRQAFGNCTGLLEVTLPVELSQADIFTNVCNVERIHYTLGSDGVMPDRCDGVISEVHYYRSTLEFYSRPALRSIDFEEGIVHIGAYAYFNDWNAGVLENMELPSTLKSVGAYAFYDQPKLIQPLALPEGLEELGEYAFYKCAFSDISIPSTIDFLPAYCFSACANFENLIIPNTVKDMGKYVFWGCLGVRHVEIPVELSRVYVLDSVQVEDVYYTANGNGVMPDRIQDSWNNDTAWTLEGKSCKTLTRVEFAEGVKHIGACAFDAGVEEGVLVSLKLPSTLESIGEYAFYAQKNLAIDLVLPEGMHRIGKYCFYNCGFTSISLPASLLEYPTGCFEGCASAREIHLPDAALKIGAYAFKNCDSIEKLVIPKGTRSIGENAFENLDSLRHLSIPVELSAPYTVSCSWDPVLETIHYTVGSTGIMPDRRDDIPSRSTPEFSACESLRTIIFDEGVKHIGDWAYYYDQDQGGLESVTLPSTLESIGEYAFYAQPKLAGPIVLPDGFKELGAHCFDRCSALEKIVLPKGLEEIPDWCFHMCNKLRTELPEGLKRIGECAFEMCPMSDGGHLVIPRSVESIGANAFLYSDNITQITLPVELDAPKGINLKGLETIHYTVGSNGIMPDRSDDGDAANHYSDYMENCASALVSVDFEEGVKHIGAYAFCNDRYTKALREVRLPSTLESIGDYAFNNREALQPVVFPASLGRIGDGAFKNCISLVEITFEGPAPKIAGDAFDIGWDIEIDAFYAPVQGGWSENVLQDYGTPMKWIAVGDNIGLNCTKVDLLLSDQAFGRSVCLVLSRNGANANADAQWVSSDASVVRVEKGRLIAAGEGCATVTAILDGFRLQCNVQVYGDVPFVRLPAGTEIIEEQAFADMTALRAVALGEHVISIGDGAFCGCENLLAINIPASVIEIAENAFEGCENLRIYCPMGSVGESYAMAHGLPCEYI